MERDNEPAESAVRANTLRATPAEVVAALAAEGVSARAGPARRRRRSCSREPYDVHGSRALRARRC